MENTQPKYKDEREAHDKGGCDPATCDYCYLEKMEEERECTNQWARIERKMRENLRREKLQQARN